MFAFRFATELSAFGSSGNGGGFEVVDVAVVVAVGIVVGALEPVSPADALVCPPLRSHGFGGDGEAISPMIVATHRSVMRGWVCRMCAAKKGR